MSFMKDVFYNTVAIVLYFIIGAALLVVSGAAFITALLVINNIMEYFNGQV